MANHGLRHLAGLPIGQMRPRNAGLGQVAPLEVGVRATLSHYTQVPAPAQNSTCWLAPKPFVVTRLAHSADLMRARQTLLTAEC